MLLRDWSRDRLLDLLSQAGMAESSRMARPLRERQFRLCPILSQERARVFVEFLSTQHHSCGGVHGACFLIVSYRGIVCCQQQPPPLLWKVELVTTTLRNFANRAAAASDTAVGIP